MKSHIFAYFLALILLSCLSYGAHHSEHGHGYSSDTVITFIVTQDQPQKPEFIRIGLNLKNKDTSLVEAMQAAQDSIQDIKDITLKYCEEHFVKVDCSQIAEVGEPEIEAQYQAIQENQRFSGFVVTHEIELKVYSTQKIGEFTDNLHDHGAQITLFKWDSENLEPGEEQLIEIGRQRAEHACQHLGMKLHKIASVKIVDGTENLHIEEDEEEQQAEEDQEEQEAEFHHPDSLKFKFRIYCQPADESQEDDEDDNGEDQDEQDEQDDKDEQDDEKDEDNQDEDEEEDDNEEDNEEEQDDEEDEDKKKKSKKKEKQDKKKKKNGKQEEKGKKKKEKKNKDDEDKAEKKQKNKKRKSEE